MPGTRQSDHPVHGSPVKRKEMRMGPCRYVQALQESGLVFRRIRHIQPARRLKTLSDNKKRKRDAGRIVKNSIDQIVSVFTCNGLAPFYRKSHSRGTHF